MINGFINVNKPSGYSSNKVVAILKRKMRAAGLTEKIGHMGTLDPLASGVLPIAVGRATRLFDYSLDKEKVYIATFILGASSETLDVDSEVIYHDLSMPSKEEILTAIRTQIGVIDQIPPMFSAKSVNGQRAYRLARSGISVVLAPKKVFISSIRLLRMDNYHHSIETEIVCGGGTYVRSIGRDVAKELHTTAVMSALQRKKSGIFDLNNALSIDEIEAEDFRIEDNLIPMEAFFDGYGRFIIEATQKKKLLDGLRLDVAKKGNEPFCVLCDGTIVGVGKCDENDQLYIKTWLI